MKKKKIKIPKRNFMWRNQWCQNRITLHQFQEQSFPFQKKGISLYLKQLQSQLL